MSNPNPCDVSSFRELRYLLQTVRVHCDALACSLPDPRARTVFAGIAAAKAELAAALDATLTPTGDVNLDEASLPAAGYATRIYAAWLPEAMRRGRSTDDRIPDVAVLDRAEDRLLQRFESALRGSQARILRDALKRYLPRIQYCHAELRRLQAASSISTSVPRSGMPGPSEDPSL